MNLYNDMKKVIKYMEL